MVGTDDSIELCRHPTNNFNLELKTNLHKKSFELNAAV